MTHACSKAVSYVASLNVVHSMERMRKASAGDGGLCKGPSAPPMREGRGPFVDVGGRSYEDISVSRDCYELRDEERASNALSTVLSAATTATLSTSKPCSLARIRARFRSSISSPPVETLSRS